MNFWDFQKRPYRPVAPNRVYVKTAGVQAIGEYRDLPPDVFLDGMGRLWYAGSEELRQKLPADPENVPKIPSEFWHPDVARTLSFQQHAERKRQLEDERYEGRRPQPV